jgi:hypothetical protein
MKVALAAGLALLAAGTALTLLRAPLVVADANLPHDSEQEAIASTRSRASYCQAGELLPRDTTVVRISLVASVGPRVTLLVSADGRVIAGGEQESGWAGFTVAVPVRPLRHMVRGVTVCASLAPANETVGLFGIRSAPGPPAHEEGRSLEGRMGIEYMRPGTRSWLSLAGEVIRHMGLGRAFGGDWIAFLVFFLLAAVAVLATRLALTELR